MKYQELDAHAAIDVRLSKQTLVVLSKQTLVAAAEHPTSAFSSRARIRSSSSRDSFLRFCRSLA